MTDYTPWFAIICRWTPSQATCILFTNKRRDRVKILYWDRDGFAIWSKRLEEGSYVIPAGSGSEARYEITAEELGALLSGIDLQSAKRRKRYQRANR